jgi:hypothetical protein
MGSGQPGRGIAPRLAAIPRSVIKPFVPQLHVHPVRCVPREHPGYFLKLNRSNKSPIAGILRGT